MNREKLSHLAISERGFIFHPGTGNTFTLNETGIMIINHLKKGDDLEDIVAHLAVIYDVEPDQARKDLEMFIEQLSRYRLV